jgi:hypothetical protein
MMACGDNVCLLVARIGEYYDVATFKQYNSVGIISCRRLDMMACRRADLIGGVEYDLCKWELGSGRRKKKTIARSARREFTSGSRLCLLRELQPLITHLTMIDVQS